MDEFSLVAFGDACVRVALNDVPHRGMREAGSRADRAAGQAFFDGAHE